MSHPSVHARTDPDKPALILAETGETVSFAELDARSNRAARLFRANGLAVGDTIALCLENCPEFYDAAWGAQRAGLVFVCDHRLVPGRTVGGEDARRIDFTAALPRHATGKLYKRLLREQYWGHTAVAPA